MNKELGYYNNSYYYLTLEGKKELIDEIDRRRLSSKSQNYEDSNFSSILEFIMRNINNTIDIALGENVKPNDIPLDRHLRIGANRRKLEAYLEAIATCYGNENISGESILRYFCSEEYEQGISTNGFVATIDGIREVVQRNIGLGNKGFLDEIRCADHQRRLKR